MTLIIGLLVLGLILISVEFFIPGGIVGGIGCLLMLAAIVLSYNAYGLVAAGWVLVGCLFGGGLWAYLMFVIVAKTPYGKKLLLSSASDGRASYGGEGSAAEPLAGAEGVAITPMSPTGRIEVSGQIYEASSQSGFLERGSRIEVVGRTSFGLVVKKR